MNTLNLRNRDVGKKIMEDKLNKLWTFLSKYLPLANSQTCDFIVNNLWDGIPKTVQDELLAMSDSELAAFPCQRSTELQTDGKTNISKSESLSTHEGGVQSSTLLDYTNVHSFVTEASKHVLDTTLLTTYTNLIESLSHNASADELPGVLMSKKKSHEVDVMAKLCSLLSQYVKTNLTVDLGSGKGYLGTRLCEEYNHFVVGIDAAQTNTDGAAKRISRMTRDKRKNVISQSASFTTRDTIQDVTSPKEGLENLETTFEQKFSLHPEIKLTCSGENDSVHSDRHSPSISSADCVFYADEDAADSSTRWYDRYIPLTKYVDPNINILDSISDGIQMFKIEADDACILLTGLHTCGGLASSMMRLFVNSPSVAVVCNVACCYHLLEESKNEVQCVDAGSVDFPLSCHLKQVGAYLGKAARNVACISVQRMAKEGQLQGSSFYSRALLQKILADHGELLKSEGCKLRKLEKRSKSLHDYMRKAFSKLGLLTELVTPEFVAAYHTQFKHVQRQLAAFVQLRAVLAPCIEAFIILDRCLYLLEQDNVKDVLITELFDPVISPRCYAVVAIKS